MALWCNDLSDIYHDANCMVESFGSRKVPTDLANGKIDIGMMSEPMSGADIVDFKNTYGYDPTGIKVAIDMIAVLVNRENPIDCLTIAELDGIYSNTYLCQGATDITTWGDLNLDGKWKNAPINMHGRTPLSATYDVFKSLVLCDGNYKDNVKEMASSRDVVDFVSKDEFSIGYSGSGYLNSTVKAVSVGQSKNNCYPPDYKNATSKQYPLTRDLYLYFRESSSNNMKKITQEFLKYILSKNGQQAVIEAGLVTLPPSVINEQKKKINN
jgi:phosphate transport system substrate-binding protein